MQIHSTLAAFLESGLPEAYAMGVATEEECAEVVSWMERAPEARDRVFTLQRDLEALAFSMAEEPPVTVRPLIPATLRFMAEAEAGRLDGVPVPELGTHSKVEDYAHWLHDQRYQAPADLEDFHAHIIGVSETTHSLIVWLRHGAPLENHSTHYEKFLIVEGTCEIVIGERVHSLGPGDFLAITPDHPHFVRVTSAHPCKIVLQRTAA